MPFELYLRADDHSKDADHNYPVYDDDHYDNANCHYSHGHHPYFPDSTHYDHHHPHGVQFRIPQFMLNGPPTLAPGGGAEVLPAGLLDSPNSLASSWFANSGFAPFHPTLISRQGASGSAQTSDSAGTNPYHAFPLGGPRHLSIDFASHFASTVDPQRQPLPEPPPSLEVTPPFNSDLVSPSPSSSASSSSSNTSYSLSNTLAPDPVSTPVNAPSSLGLPVYSASGFDILSILSRVVNRPNPTVELGPVDLSCSFVIADVRRYDCPIVYASPTFYRLTGYSEQEVLGRNCRFLQSPTGNVARGEQRRFASPEAVSYMRKHLYSYKECQTSLINYRKGGHAFINLVTVIPLKGGVHNRPEEADEVVYHVGFQVDLTEQPVRILDKLRNGTYYSGWGSSSVPNNLGLGLKQGPGPVLGQLGQPQNVANLGLKGGRHGQMMSIAVSKELRNLIADTTFTDSVPISTGTNISSSTGASSSTSEQGGRSTTTLTSLTTPSSGGAVTSGSIGRLAASGGSTTGPIHVPLSPSLSLMLLELLPDFVLVLSLKGAFLYVAPSVRLVLGYEPQELVGRGISDICHPADLVPLMRELKEGSVSGVGASGLGGEAGLPAAGSNILPKPVDLLFRAMPKTSTLSPFPRTQEASASSEPGDSHHTSCESPPSSSASQPSSSSGTLSSVDTLDEITSPYVWLECRGRLHVEPGKGRKAIILSGRARWMPVVRWASVGKAGASSLQSQSTDALSGGMGSGTPPPSFHPREGQRSRSATAPSDSSEFWALLSLQGTILVASASVRDVLGWGVGEMIGRSIWAMVGDGRNGVKARVEAELAELGGPEMDDPPPTIVTTSLVHKEARLVHVRLLFYRTPRSHTHSVSSIPLIHPRNNPLCPIVCQVVTLSSTEYSSAVDPIDRTHSRVHSRSTMDDEPDGPSPLMHPSAASLFEELNTARGSSWQYELQQLKFANQRLHEELHALEGAANAGSALIPSIVQPPPSSAVAAPPPQGLAQTRHPQFPLQYTPLMHATLPTSMSSRHLPNSLHEQAPPPSEWSSLAGANGQGPNPLKRTWHSEDGPTT